MTFKKFRKDLKEEFKRKTKKAATITPSEKKFFKSAPKKAVLKLERIAKRKKSPDLKKKIRDGQVKVVFVNSQGKILKKKPKFAKPKIKRKKRVPSVNDDFNFFPTNV